jgi:hypothetical protein
MHTGFLVLCIVLAVMNWIACTGLITECKRTAYGAFDMAVIGFMYVGRLAASIMIILVGVIN